MTERRGWDRTFVIGLVIGLAVMVYGVAGLLTTTNLTRARQIATWAIAANLIHDAILAPIAAAVGLVVARFVPRGAWPAVRAGLIASACTIAVAYPLLRGFGHDTVPDNTSVAPLEYRTAVPTVLAVVWLVVGGYLLGRRLWAGRGSDTVRRP